MILNNIHEVDNVFLYFLLTVVVLRQLISFFYFLLTYTHIDATILLICNNIQNIIFNNLV